MYRRPVRNTFRADSAPEDASERRVDRVRPNLLNHCLCHDSVANWVRACSAGSLFDKLVARVRGDCDHDSDRRALAESSVGNATASRCRVVDAGWDCCRTRDRHRTVCVARIALRFIAMASSCPRIALDQSWVALSALAGTMRYSMIQHAANKKAANQRSRAQRVLGRIGSCFGALVIACAGAAAQDCDASSVSCSRAKPEFTSWAGATDVPTAALRGPGPQTEASSVLESIRKALGPRPTTLGMERY